MRAERARVRARPQLRSGSERGRLMRAGMMMF